MKTGEAVKDTIRSSDPSLLIRDARIIRTGHYHKDNQDIKRIVLFKNLTSGTECTHSWSPPSAIIRCRKYGLNGRERKHYYQAQDTTDVVIGLSSTNYGEENISAAFAL